MKISTAGDGMAESSSEAEQSRATAEGGSTSRRGVIAGVGAAGVVAALAACGTAAPTSTGGDGGGNTAGAGSPTAGGASSGSGGSAIKAGDIPVGGGKIYANDNVVVTQPTAGQFKAFGTTCPHAGCQVTKVADGTINCPCHGSQFSIADGSVKAGPAPKGLTAKTVTKSGTDLKIA
jgi:Rieske Fe-S protein